MIKIFYLVNFLYKYGKEKRIKKESVFLEKAKYKELKVKWSNKILNSVDRSIKTNENNRIR